ncbi:MAG: hypothetical protein L3J56_05140 [Bacteroidales bacterium]|nr:hypothetical protein [Bacteroidales bacterium]
MKRKKVDNRTELEKKFEDAGQEAGKKTGEFVQKSIDKFEDVKVKVKADDKIGKVKEFTLKAEDKIDEIVEKATKASKDTYVKVKEKVGK